MREALDYVVIGGGTAGSVMASRLSEDPDVRVLLLEADGSEGPAAMSMAPLWSTLLGSPVDWNFQTVPQPGLAGRTIPYPRGKVLGGSSGINAMLHVRGPREAIDAWTTYGAPGWGYDDLLPYYRRSEHTEGRDPAYRGVGGPMRPQQVKRVHPFAASCLTAFGLLGYPILGDLNANESEGATLSELTAADGVRQTAADAYIRPVAGRPNLTIVTDAFVERLEFVAGRCQRVHYRKAGKRHTAIADREFADHTITSLVWRSLRTLEPGVNAHTDVIAAPRSTSSSPYPDVQLVCMDVAQPVQGAGLALPTQGFKINVAAMNPHSRGTVRLASAQPATAPLIDPESLGDERDVKTLLAGMNIARDVVASHSLNSWHGDEVSPGLAANDKEIREYARHTTVSYFHPCGTCRMGGDAKSVVDLNLRVRGVEGLRVVDASVMPSIPAANLNATVLAIAERAAARITGR